MKPNEQRLAISKVCGWQGSHPSPSLPKQWLGYKGSSPQDSGWKCVPDYLNDLNAMHEAEKVMSADQRRKWSDILLSMYVVGTNVLSATATQRAEAFLRALNLWK